MVVIQRYDPRADKNELKALFEDFIEHISYLPGTWEKFEKEVENRALDLRTRNSMVVAKEDGKLVGWATYTKITDYLGNSRVLLHQVITKKADSFKKGIEEELIHELEAYIKKTEHLDRVYIRVKNSDNQSKSLLLKMGYKKSEFMYYERKT